VIHTHGSVTACVESVREFLDHNKVGLSSSDVYFSVSEGVGVGVVWHSAHGPMVAPQLSCISWAMGGPAKGHSLLMGAGWVSGERPCTRPHCVQV
jgi:hypothetical protein